MYGDLLAPSVRQSPARHSHSSGSPQAQILADHLALVRSDMIRNTDQMLSLMAERVEAFQKQAVSKVELEFIELRAENENLRSELASARAYCNRETGGTGDTAPPRVSERSRFRSEDEDEVFFEHSRLIQSSMDHQLAAEPPGTLSSSELANGLPNSLVELADGLPNSLVAEGVPNSAGNGVTHVGSTSSGESLHKSSLRNTAASTTSVLESGPPVSVKKSVQLPPCLPEDPQPPCEDPMPLKMKFSKRLTKRSKSRAFSTMYKLPSIKKLRSERQRIFPSSNKAAEYEDMKKNNDKKHGHASDSHSEKHDVEAVAVASSRQSAFAGPSLQASALDGARAAKVFGRGVASQHPNRGIAAEASGNDEASTRSRRVSGINREAQAVFADATAMKERVRQAVAKHDYNVADFYWDDGMAQFIARSQYFEWTTLGVIAFNAIWIAIDMDNNHEDVLLEADAVYQIAEHSFCIYFTFEWLVRFLAFKVKRDCLRDAWFCFDSCLVIMMILETWVMNLVLLVQSTSTGSSSGLGNTSVLKLVRLVRLTRMARMAKLLHAVPELIILIKGIAVAARTVFFTLLLLAIIIYFFAIVFRTLTDDSDIGDRYFPSVTASMGTLLLDGVIPDQSHLVRENDAANFFLGALVVLFILLATLTVMNMLVGVLCEVVSVVSAVEKEQLTVNYVKHKLLKMFDDPKVDKDGSCSISRKEFEDLLVNEEAAACIQDMGVDVVGLVDFADIIFEDDIELTFGDFMELVLQLRGTNTCTVKDIVDLRKFVVTEFNNLQRQVAEAMEEVGDKDRTSRFKSFTSSRLTKASTTTSFPVHRYDRDEVEDYR